jgi:hypothetical protein
LPSPTPIAVADLPPENAIPTAPLKATRHVPVKISPSGIVIVTGPVPSPVRTKLILSLPICRAASFNGKVSAVSAQPKRIGKASIIDVRITVPLRSGRLSTRQSCF